MPGGSRTGPRGMGPRTGRAAGYCAGFEAPGYANTVSGCDFGMGFGRGRRFSGGGRGGRNRIRFGGSPVPYDYPISDSKPDPEMEKRALRNQAEALKTEVAHIHRRLSELEAGNIKE